MSIQELISNSGRDYAILYSHKSNGMGLSSWVTLIGSGLYHPVFERSCEEGKQVIKVQKNISAKNVDYVFDYRLIDSNDVLMFYKTE